MTQPEDDMGPEVGEAVSVGRDPFASTLTVSEFALLGAAGVRPLGAVMGCQVDWISEAVELPTLQPRGAAWAPKQSRRYEGDVIPAPNLDAAVTQARHRAFGQLAEEAAAIGADAVIGVHDVPTPHVNDRLRRKPGRLRSSLTAGVYVSRRLAYQLVGTAICDPANRSDAPQVSTLSVADFCKLRAGGWLPAGVVGGCSHQVTRNIGAGPVAREVEEATAVWQAARAAALEQCRRERDEASADGMIDLDMQTSHQTYAAASATAVAHNALLVSVSVLASAIRRASDADPVALAPTKLLMLR
jgi:uncharacterized protein YbjQ (UPF0145 family)